jgi:UDP-N-acetylglucosamine 2-epimerase (non-hydrolysing)
VIFGTRPEAIKLAPVVLGLRAARDIECRVCATAQHREMLDQVLEAFGIRADADLDLMRPGQSLGELTASAIRALDSWLAGELPDLVLVQGDTTTVLCAALAAFYNGIPLGHVEAGLRTGDLSAPWPEEANRQMVSRLASVHFAPTAAARDNLLKESVPSTRVHVTGNTVIDALLLAREKVREAPPAVPGLAEDALRSARRMVLITGHRRESFGTGIRNLCGAIADLAGRFPEVDFVYPVHLNPRVREPVRQSLGAGNLDNVFLLDPLGYLPFVALMDRCTLVLTDSGGIQEEAPALGKPVVVTRSVTERPEAVEAGAALLAGTDRDLIVKSVSGLLSERSFYDKMAKPRNIYGNGKAARRIVEICGKLLQQTRA